MGSDKVVGSACSGSGAPSFALRQLVGDNNFDEVVSSENHAAQFNLQHYSALKQLKLFAAVSLASVRFSFHLRRQHGSSS